MAKKGTAKGKGHIFKRGKIFYLQYDVNGKRFVQSLNYRIFYLSMNLFFEFKKYVFNGDLMGTLF